MAPDGRNPLVVPGPSPTRPPTTPPRPTRSDSTCDSRRHSLTDRYWRLGPRAPFRAFWRQRREVAHYQQPYTHADKRHDPRQTATVTQLDKEQFDQHHGDQRCNDTDRQSKRLNSSTQCAT